MRQYESVGVAPTGEAMVRPPADKAPRYQTVEERGEQAEARSLGENARGFPLFEEADGRRYYEEDGERHYEPGDVKPVAEKGAWWKTLAEVNQEEETDGGTGTPDAPDAPGGADQGAVEGGPPEMCREMEKDGTLLPSLLAAQHRALGILEQQLEGGMGYAEAETIALEDQFLPEEEVQPELGGR